MGRYFSTIGVCREKSFGQIAKFGLQGGNFAIWGPEGFFSDRPHQRIIRKSQKKQPISIPAQLPKNTKYHNQ